MASVGFVSHSIFWASRALCAWSDPLDHNDIYQYYLWDSQPTIARVGLLVGGAASQVIPLVLVPKQSPHDPVPFRALVRAWTACMSGLGWLLESRFVRPDPQNHRAVLHVEMVNTSCCLMGISSTCIGSDLLLNRMELFVPPMVVFVIALSASGAICYYSLEQRHSDNASLSV
jgi:hypothetical protein